MSSNQAQRSSSSRSDLDEGALDGGAVGDEVRRRVDGHVRRPVEDLAADGVEADDLLDLVAPELDADGGVLRGGPDLDGVAAHAELAARGLEVVARVLDVDELAQHLVAVDGVADAEQDHLLEVVLGRAQAVDAAHAGDDDDVAAQEQRGGGRVAQPVDLVVDRRVLLDVQVLRRHVGLGLVVVVVADEVLDGVVREELAELVAELRRERLVVGDDQRGLLDLRDDVGHREGLARAGDAEQRLVAVAAQHALAERGDGLGLVAGEAVVGLDAKVVHALRLYQHEHTFARDRRAVSRGARQPVAVGLAGRSRAPRARCARRRASRRRGCRRCAARGPRRAPRPPTPPPRRRRHCRRRWRRRGRRRTGRARCAGSSVP